MNINQRCENLIRTVIETEYQNPSMLILKHAKEFHEVNKSHLLNLLKMVTCMIYTVLKPIHSQGTNHKLATIKR